MAERIWRIRRGEGVAGGCYFTALLLLRIVVGDFYECAPRSCFYVYSFALNWRCRFTELFIVTQVKLENFAEILVAY
jgi:hypothetical protein